MSPEQPLPEPVVSAELYGEDYYTNWCAGYAEWTASGGSQISGLYPGMLRKARLRAGEVLVDIGTGRGEMLAAAVKLGARRAMGVEYSATAVDMARTTLAANQVGDRAEVHLADARAMPVPDAVADLVTMMDVVEHLAPEELARTLREAHRVLKPGGRIVCHTMPNRLIYDVTYRWQRLARPGRRRSWPENPRNEYERMMHVNEQTKRSLASSLRSAGFDAKVEYGAWIHDEFVPDERARRLYRRLGKVPVMKRYGVADLWGFGIKRG